MKFPCTLKNALLNIRVRFGLSFASKGLGYLAALLLLLPLLARYKLSCYQTTLLLTISALADITLLKTACYFLLLLVGTTIDPLYLWVIKTLSGAVAVERSAFDEWNLVRKHLYYVLKFTVTCHYGK